MSATPPKRLQKSRTQRIMFGVTGGIAEYLGIDVVLVRVGFLVLALLDGVGIIAYIALAIFMPNAPEPSPLATPAAPSGETHAPQPSTPTNAQTGPGRYLVGALLIAIGVIFLLQQFHFLWWWRWGVLWPVALIIIGVALVAGRLRR